MSQEWDLVPLGKIINPVERPEMPIAGKQYRQVGIRLWGEGAYERDSIDGSQTQYKILSRVEENDIVVNKIWARNGSVSVIPANLAGCYVSSEFPCFTTISTELEAKYFYWYTKIKQFWTQCDIKSQGTSGKNRIRPEKFLEVEIPLPPLDVQRRIVAKVEAIAAKIEEARGLRVSAIENSQSIYKSYLSEIIQPQNDNWIETTIDKLIVSMDAGWSPQCESFSASKDEWGILKTTSVQWNKFLFHENKVIPKNLTPRPNLTVIEGDVLITRAGPRNRVGVVAAVRESYPYLMISDKLIRIRVDRSKIEPRFLEISLSSSYSQEYLVSRKTGLADAQVNISQSILRSMPIAYPDLPEQRRIVEYLDSLQTKVDEMKRIRQEALRELDAMLPSILDRAFKGEL